VNRCNWTKINHIYWYSLKSSLGFLCIFSVCSYKWKIHNGKISAIFVLFTFIYIYFDFALVFTEFLVNRCIHYVYQNVKQKKAMVFKGESPDIETVYNSLGFSNYHSSMWVSIWLLKAMLWWLFPKGKFRTSNYLQFSWF
jgi:hypothetical protein